MKGEMVDQLHLKNLCFKLMLPHELLVDGWEDKPVHMDTRAEFSKGFLALY